MFRYAIILLVFAATVDSQDVPLETHFNDYLNQNKSHGDLKCNNIQGALSGCYNCYTCDHQKVSDHTNRRDSIERIKLVDNNCGETEVCCVSQLDLDEHRISDSCGKSNQEGWPRRVRSSLRAILQGEYPWRAWIYESVCRLPNSYPNQNTITLE